MTEYKQLEPTVVMPQLTKKKKKRKSHREKDKNLST